MRIIKQSVKLIGLMIPVSYNKYARGGYAYDLSEQGPEKLIETAGRTCYKSEDKITSDSHKAFIEKISKLCHESVLEHSCASFRIITDRGVTHELVRHRLASYSQESTRYCSYNKEKFGSEISVIEPPGLDKVSKSRWRNAVSMAELVYLQLTEQKVPPQIARSVLPTCLKTEIVMTCNFREWQHFLKLRTSVAAHPQMREIALMIKTELQKVAPTVFKES